jgi:hypothetical protein
LISERRTAFAGPDIVMHFSERSGKGQLLDALKNGFVVVLKCNLEWPSTVDGDGLLTGETGHRRDP